MFYSWQDTYRILHGKRAGTVFIHELLTFDVSETERVSSNGVDSYSSLSASIHAQRSADMSLHSAANSRVWSLFSCGPGTEFARLSGAGHLLEWSGNLWKCSARHRKWLGHTRNIFGCYGNKSCLMNTVNLILRQLNSICFHVGQVLSCRTHGQSTYYY